ncbi:hypothetical protein [Nocardioides allogilvus]|uniref:hypothetical protein n=1 Tax=Nocardioides allogilvus TaxID=2072017 RepID=UPI001E3C1C64|nr:hypothetical protein [Nocardioides allogilvus]
MRASSSPASRTSASSPRSAWDSWGRWSEGLSPSCSAPTASWELNIIGFVLAVLAAVLLIGVAEGIAGKNKSHA